MSNTESPAGGPGGQITVPALDDLPERMRVHALARRLARTSREVLAALASLGVEVRSAQSSVERKVAEQVAAKLDPETEQPAAQDTAPQEPDEQAAEPGAPLAPVFAPPAPLFQAPSRSKRKRAEPTPVERPAEPPATDTADPAEAADTADTNRGAATDDDGDDSDDGNGRRRRRRGRRGRGRGRGVDGADDETADDETEGGSTGGSGDDAAESGEGDSSDDSEDEGEQDDASEGDDGGASRRRRRRRRRRGSGDDAADGADEVDPPNTVTKVRTPREQRDDEGDGVQSVRGSTRLEAKRQRRRDGRDAGRRRVPILSEAEFLARRESVDRSMVVRERGDRVEIAVLEDDVLVEHFVNSASGRDGGTGKSLVGNVYLGRVQNVLPSMEAAFVDIGRGRNAVLYAGEVDWDAAGLGGKRAASSRRCPAATACSCRSRRTRSGTRVPGSPPRSAWPAASSSTCRAAAPPGSAASCPTSSASGSRTCSRRSSPARPG